MSSTQTLISLKPLLPLTVKKAFPSNFLPSLSHLGNLMLLIGLGQIPSSERISSLMTVKYYYAIDF